MSLNEKIPIQIELGTLATLVAGLYCTYSGVNPMAVPESLWIEIAEKLAHYLENWNYDESSFEEFIQYNLLIVPKVLCTEEELEQYKSNSEYFERNNGNAILVVTFEV